jgi:hypothetical protein
MKKNKNLFGILILLVLLLVTGYLVTKNSTGTLKKELTNFAVKDTAAITKIFMADKQNHTILLERQSPGTWLLNKKYMARKDAVNTLLSTMKDLSVKAPVAKGAFDNVVKHLATSSVKVEIYIGDKLEKVYYVGHNTQDYSGTFMMLENSSTPFVMWIAGFEGYLGARYFLEEESWKSTVLYSYPVSTIRSLKIEYPNKPRLSFELDFNGSTLSLFTGDHLPVARFDTAKAYEYLLGFKDVHYEYAANELTKSATDSVLMRKPMHIITITDNKGRVDKLVTYPKMASVVQITQDSTLIYDVDRMYALHNQDDHLLAVQYYVFDHLLKPIDYFSKSASSAK